MVGGGCRVRGVGAAYLIFAIALVGVAVLGGIAGCLGIGKYVLERLELVVTIIVGLSAAGLLSLAFVVDQLASANIDLGTFFNDRGGLSIFAAVFWQLAVGGSGLFVALGIVILGEHPRRSRLNSLLRGWAGGCLAVSAMTVVLLFPATIVQILSAGDTPLYHML